MYVNVLICNERDAHASVQMEAWYNWVFCVVELHKAEKQKMPQSVEPGRHEQDMGNKINSLQSKQRRSHLSHDETL